MITLKLLGGLGNQLFIWALGRALQAKGRDVYYDTTAYIGNTHRQYWLAPFDDLKFNNEPSKDEIYEGSHVFNPDFLTPREGSKLIGYFQCEQYFAGIADELRSHVNQRWMNKPLTGYVKEIEKEIYRQPSVFLHVRRQDYVNLQHFHGLQPIEYYREALKLVRSRHFDVKPFVFSDDIPWCQEWFPKDFTFVQGTNMWEDIRLMAGCKHSILANSSFGWWASWFGDNQLGRTIVAPKKWFTSPDVDDRDLIPSRWTRI
jgi:hypothetical protein